MRLNLGLDLGKRGGRTGGGAPAWLPSSLTGYVGSPFSVAYFRGLGTLWQDTAKTIPATADGDPVRVAVCDGVDWTAPTDAARPLLWDEGGGKWSFYFDGVDDFLSCAAISFAQPFSVWSAAARMGASALGSRWWGSGSGTSCYSVWDADSREVYAGGAANGAGVYATVPDETWYVWGDEIFSPTSSAMERSGVAMTTGTNSALGASPLTRPAIAASENNTNHKPLRCAGFLALPGVISSDDRVLLRDYLTALA